MNQTFTAGYSSSGAANPSVASPVRQGLDRVAYQIQRNSDLINALYARLDGAIRPPYPNAPTAKGLVPVDEALGSSEISTSLRGLHDSLRDQNDRIDDLLSRLEV